MLQAEDGIRDRDVTGVQTCALPISKALGEAIVNSQPDSENADLSSIVPFRRIQFTPDLLPSDVTGGSV